MSNELIGNISNEGELKGIIEDDNFHVMVQITESGLRGEQGTPGKDGYTPIKGVDYFDGIDGKDGYTPIKGIDYFDGEKGEKGTDANYVHDQISSAKEWRIIHSLGKYPSVTIVDSGGNVVVGDIKYVSTDEIEISFSFEFSGKAYLN